jgi:intein/homing endonuclease
MDIQELIEEYNNGASMAQLSRKYNITSYKIKKILEKNNIYIRSRAEQNRISNAQRANSVNNNYFSNITTVNQAWLLGFLAADGWVEKNRNRINLELAAVDKEILEKIKKEIEIENGILERETNKGFSIVRLSWTSGIQKDKLSQYGIVPNKTYKEMHLPLFENKDLTYAFILGYFDGDGSISINNDYCRFRICAYRPELLQDIYIFLGKCGNISQDNRGLWELSISTNYSVPLFQKLYSLNSLHLARKYNKFLEYNTSKRV